MRIVIKIGSSVITQNGRLNQSRLAELVGEIAKLKENNEIVIVSSGAVASGAEFIDTQSIKKEAPQEQILASVGQPHLVARYFVQFRKYGITVAQALVTRDDFNHRQHYLNIRDTLVGLLEQDIIPIINENDVISFAKGDEGQFDNDNLASLIALTVDADRFLILFGGEGFINNGKVMRNVEVITEEIEAAVTKEISQSGRGGMRKKLDAIRLATSVGISVDLLPGMGRGAIKQAINTKSSVGTHFAQRDIILNNRQKWLLAGAKKSGGVSVDEKAVEALRKKKSLLAVGITKVDGSFNRDSVIAILSGDSETIGAGITNYNSEEIERIKGQSSDKIKSALGYKIADEVIHRDHMVII